MSSTPTSLGACPRCGADLPRNSLLIEYETDDGSAVYAECPDCETVVHPDGS